jgi:hypothetical protein
VNDRVTATGSRKRGVVLVLVILLLGLVAILTIHAQMTVARSLKRARDRSLRSDLRLAAADAVWYLLQTTAGASFPPTDESGNCVRVTPLPAGGETSVVVVRATNVNDSIVSALLTGSHKNDTLYLVDACASVSGTSERVSCVVLKDAAGTIEVAGWLRGQERGVRRQEEPR